MACPLSEERKQQWKEEILNQRSSGLCVAAWCRRSKIAVHNFYYWQNKLFPKDVFTRPAFIEIVNEEKLNTSGSGIALECQGVNIHLSPNFEPSVLKRCLEVLKGC